MPFDPPYSGRFILNYSALTSILDVVNQLISSLGEAPVATVEPPTSSDVDLALGCINEKDIIVQTEGWEWNRLYGWPLTIARDGTVPLPSNTLRCVKAYATAGQLGGVNSGGFNSYAGQAIKIVALGDKLYDQVNNTAVFTVAPVVDLIVRRPWNEIPAIHRMLIAYEALKTFQARVQQSQITLQFNQADLDQARKLTGWQQDDESQENSIDGNVNVISALYGIGGMRRNRGGY